MATDDRQMAKKALLCFHGTGSKGSIFNVQMARIYYQLHETFEFIFLDGPRECPPGPGVLPTFSGQEPYYGWFGGHDVSLEDSIREINESVQKGLDNWRNDNDKRNDDVEIVGGIGFSEGGLALALLLWLQQEQQQQQQEQKQEHLTTLPPLQFAVLSCCFFPRESSLWIKKRAAQATDNSKTTTSFIDIPTLHIHGNRDFCLGRARQLVRNHYQPQYATIIQVDSGHHMPTKKDDVDQIVRQIWRLAGG